MELFYKNELSQINLLIHLKSNLGQFAINWYKQWKHHYAV